MEGYNRITGILEQTCPCLPHARLTTAGLGAQLGSCWNWYWYEFHFCSLETKATGVCFTEHLQAPGKASLIKFLSLFSSGTGDCAEIRWKNRGKKPHMISNGLSLSSCITGPNVPFHISGKNLSNWPNTSARGEGGKASPIVS